MDTESLRALSEKLYVIQGDLKDAEATTKDCIKHLKDTTTETTYQGITDADTLADVSHIYETYLDSYELLYEVKNDEYQSSIRGLSDSYLSLCPFYVGPSLPKTTFIDSKLEMTELYGLFIIMGVASMFGLGRGSTPKTI
tara:strand:+ start:1364 stop:1783 length:420 start_codon:yes stop_codon:yes gene_type:complete